MSTDKESPKKKILHVIGWIVSIIFLLFAILIFSVARIWGAAVFIAALLANPMIRLRLGWKRRTVILVCVALVLGGMVAEVILDPANPEATQQESPNSSAVSGVEEPVESISVEPEPEPTPEEIEADFKASCQEYGFKTLMRNPDDYIGKKLILQVRIAQDLGSGKYAGYTQSDSGWYGDRYYLVDAREDDFKILEDDIITIYGTFDGLVTIKTVLGAREEAPSVSICYATLDEE